MAYNHREAFCIMQYKDNVTGEVERLWNSRDGVTPFIIKSPKGNEANHIAFQEDECVPDFTPPRGMRVFVDALPTHRHIRRSAAQYVDKYWDLDIGGGMKMCNTLHKPSGAEMTKGEARDFFINEWTKPGAPTIVVAGSEDYPFAR